MLRVHVRVLVIPEVRFPSKRALFLLFKKIIYPVCIFFTVFLLLLARFGGRSSDINIHMKTVSAIFSPIVVSAVPRAGQKGQLPGASRFKGPRNLYRLGKKVCNPN